MATTSDPSPPSGSARPCILLVEDELLIRLLIGDELRDFGFGVIEAYNADEALRVLDSAVHIDLVISDVKMPGSIDGMALLTIVRERFPATPVIITSGHLESARAIANGASRFVPKPFSIELMVAIVREELEKQA